MTTCDVCEKPLVKSTMLKLEYTRPDHMVKEFEIEKIGTLSLCSQDCFDWITED